jgi:2'-5' RNA ligase
VPERLLPVRLFIAVRPSIAAADLVDRVPRPEAPRVRWLPRDQWHVTLRFLGDAEPDEVVAALAAVAWGRVPPVDVTLGPATEVLGESVVMVPAAGCDALVDWVVAATGGLGREPEDRPFVGHLTLGRFRDEPPTGSIGTPISATFQVDEVLLVASQTRPEGAVHEVVARFPLDGEVEGG